MRQELQAEITLDFVLEIALPLVSDVQEHQAFCADKEPPQQQLPPPNPSSKFTCVHVCVYVLVIKKASAFLFQMTFAALAGRAKGNMAEAVEDTGLSWSHAITDLFSPWLDAVLVCLVELYRYIAAMGNVPERTAVPVLLNLSPSC